MNRGVIVAGTGEAGPWFAHASAVRACDVDLLDRAMQFDLMRDLSRRTCADGGWLVVVQNGPGVEHALEIDPAVVAYCDAPVVE